jgi:hypothetical protein
MSGLPTGGGDFTCEVCGNTYTKARSDEEAFAECEANFGVTPAKSDCGIVCEECYQKFMEWRRSQPAERPR